MSVTQTISNGIDVDQLVATVEAVKGDPQAATFTFRASSRWEDGTHNVGEIGRFVHAGQEDESRPTPFSMDGDEPPVLLGHNQAPMPWSCCCRRSASATPSGTSPTRRLGASR